MRETVGMAGAAPGLSLSLAGSLPLQQREPVDAGRRPPPGSAAASAAQVEALLDRLEELETEAAERRKEEGELKAVNIALMERLAEFHSMNEENLNQAEAQLSSMACQLERLRVAHGEAESELAETRRELGAAGVRARLENRRRIHAAARGEVRERVSLQDGLLPDVRARTLRAHCAAWRRQLIAMHCGRNAQAAAARRLCSIILQALRIWVVHRRAERSIRTRSLHRRQTELLGRVMRAWSTVLAFTKQRAPATLRYALDQRPVLSTRSTIRRWRAHCIRRSSTRALVMQVMRRGAFGFVFLCCRQAFRRWQRAWRASEVWNHLLGRAVAGQLMACLRMWERAAIHRERMGRLVHRAGGVGTRASCARGVRKWRAFARVGRRCARFARLTDSHCVWLSRRHCQLAMRAWRAYNNGHSGPGTVWNAVCMRWFVLRLRAGFRALRKQSELTAGRRAASWWSSRLGRRRAREQLWRGIQRWRSLAIRKSIRRRREAEALRDESVALLAQARASSAALERENAHVQQHVGRATEEIGVLQRRMHQRVAESEAEVVRLREHTAQLQAQLEERTTQRQKFASASERAERELSSLREEVDQTRLRRTIDAQQERQRTRDLQSRLEERERALKSSEEALARTSEQLQRTVEDRSTKLRSAFDVAASLRALLEQKEAELSAALTRAKQASAGQAASVALACDQKVELEALRLSLAAAEGELTDARLAVKRSAATVGALTSAAAEKDAMVAELRDEAIALRAKAMRTLHARGDLAMATAVAGAAHEPALGIGSEDHPSLAHDAASTEPRSQVRSQCACCLLSAFVLCDLRPKLTKLAELTSEYDHFEMNEQAPHGRLPS